jgi:tetratricopeptide (TPR) repeat protein
MRHPKSSEEARDLLKLKRSDIGRYMDVVNKWIADDPRDAMAYFDRHSGWMALGRPKEALADLDRAIELDPTPMDYLARGDVHRELGDLASALADYSTAEALMTPKAWDTMGLGLIRQAMCHAGLGDHAAALACCARMPDDLHTPGLHGAPAGGKAEIAAEALRIAAQARRRR